MNTRIKKLAWPWAMLAICLMSLFLLPRSASSEENYVFERMWPTLQQPWYFSRPSGVAADTSGFIFVADNGNDRIQKFTSDGQFVTKWGSRGDGEGEFMYPEDITVDNNGFIYVVEWGNNRVQKFTSDGQFVAKWGGVGNSEVTFNGPRGVAADTSGFIYVADSGNDRIQKFTSDGQLVAAWGSEGSADGELNFPNDIAIDSNGFVYVADTANDRIQKFTSDGQFVTKWEPNFRPLSIATGGNDLVYVAGDHSIHKFTADGQFVAKWGTWGSQDGEFRSPHGVAVDINGFAYVADSDNNRIQKFTADGQFLAKWGSSGSGDGEFSWPHGIGVDTSGFVYVADSDNNRIQKFTANGQFVAAWGSPGSGDGELGSPSGIAADNTGFVYVAEAGNNRIQKFTTDGEFVAKWGSLGSGPTEFDHPYALAVDNNGYVYVADNYNHRIQKFTTDGQFVAKWGTWGSEDGELIYPRGIAIESSDFVYVAEDGNHRIQKFTTDGQFVAKWGSLGSGEGEFYFPSGIAIESNDFVYVADASNHRIQKFTTDGQFVAKFSGFGSEPGLLNSPRSLCVGTDNNVYVSDTYNHRIQVFSIGTAASPGQIVDKAIIIAGGGPYPGNNIWDATQMCANYAYRALTYQGYTKDTIFYLTSDTDLDLDGNGILDDVDEDATNTNLQHAITTWAQDAEDLFIYIVNHGGEGTFRMGPTELLYATDLDAWLDEIQQTIPGSVTLLYDACRSGSFLPSLIPPAGKTRVSATSASSDQEAIFASQGTVSFSFLFWGHIFNGDSFYDSFVNTTNSIGLTYSQDPLLEGNWDDAPNQREDQEVARLLKLGNETKSAGDIPSIGSVSPSQTLYEETSALIYAAEVIDADGISRVWAVISSPGYAQNPNEPVTDLPILELTSVGNNRYEGTYSDFSAPGTYTIAIYAADRWGVISLPKSTSVSVSGAATAVNLYFPHVETNNLWETEIALINTSSTQTAISTLKGYSNTGQLIDTMPITLAPHARRQITISDELTNSTSIGYLIFETDSDTVCGYTKFYISGTYRVAVPAVKEINTGNIYLSHIDSSPEWWTGVSLLNTTTSEKILTVSFNTGQSTTITLNANEHQAFTIRDLFGGEPQPGIHSAVITNASGVVGLELFGSASGGHYLSGILLKDDTTSTIYYPHIASDETWWTGIVAYNPSSTSSTITVTSYAEDGTSLGTTDPIVIGAGEKYIGTVPDLSLPSNTAWIKIDATTPITGFELFGTTNGNQLAGYTGVGISGKEGVFAKIEKEGWTGIALVNIETSQAPITLTAYDNYGNAIAAEAVILSAHEKLVNTVEDIFSGKDISTATYIRYSSDKEVVGFQLNGSSDGMMLDGLPGM
jgi:sugar lactone lactonase YvrE